MIHIDCKQNIWVCKMTTFPKNMVLSRKRKVINFYDWMGFMENVLYIFQYSLCVAEKWLDKISEGEIYHIILPKLCVWLHAIFQLVSIYDLMLCIAPSKLYHSLLAHFLCYSVVLIRFYKRKTTNFSTKVRS